MKLIITADDFGRSPEINGAIVQAHRHGVLTSASLMVAGDAVDEAVALARQMPTLAVGLHVVLVDGAPVLAPKRLDRLVDQHGRFPNAPARLGLRYFFNSRARAQMLEELEAQFRRFAETGLKLAHVDGHQHMHVHPSVFPTLLSLARQYGAGGIRLPRDELLFSLRYNPRHAMRKTAWATVFSLLSRRCEKLLRDGSPALAGHVYGLMQTGQMDEAYVLALLRHIEGRSAGRSAEIYFHPTTGRRTDDLGPNPQELQTLLSATIRREIELRNLQLCAYADL